MAYQDNTLANKLLPIGGCWEQDIYNEDWLKKPPTLVQEILVAVDGGITMQQIQWSEHDKLITECWKSLRSGLRMFLHAVSTGIDILGNTSVPWIWQKLQIRGTMHFKIGWKEPDFRSTSVCDLQTRRMIISLERFLYSRANMNLNPIEEENRLHAKMEGGYIVMLRIVRLPL